MIQLETGKYWLNVLINPEMNQVGFPGKTPKKGQCTGSIKQTFFLVTDESDSLIN